MPVIKRSHPQIKPTLLQKIPNVFRKTVFSNIPNRSTSPVKPQVHVSTRGALLTTKFDGEGKKSAKEIESLTAEVADITNGLPISASQNNQENSNRRRKRFLKKYSAKIGPKIAEQADSTFKGKYSESLKNHNK